MACKLIYKGVKFDTEEQILEYINSGKYPNFGEALRGKSFFEAIDYVETQLTSEFDKRLIKALRNKARRLGNHRFNITINKTPPKSASSAIARAKPTVVDDQTVLMTLEFYESTFDKINPSFFLHELVHAVTLMEINNADTKQVQQLKKLSQDVIDELFRRHENRTSTPQENYFLAYTNAWHNADEILA